MSATLVLQDLTRLEQLYAAGFHDSFLDNALRKMIARQIARDEADLTRLTPALAEFERATGMSSDEFWRRYQAGKMADTADAMEWNALCKMRQRIMARLEILRGARAHA
ncbi:MAG: hypothetical protein L0Y55_19570 [Anaerolineales bacterium]|nr:hypothetical protein [Anaerolineales bacterium]